MFCAISGTVPEEPVVSKLSGHLFEKRLVEKYIKETGKCPVTGNEITADDLVIVTANRTVKPRPQTATSIPGLLGLLHDEWDALLLETHTLRQSLNTVRQELSHALYQHDAACRVIARLLKERDEARAALEHARETFKKELGTKRAEPESNEDEEVRTKRSKKVGIPQEVLDEMQEVSANLSKARKKRVISPTLASPEEISEYSLLGSHPLHQTTQGGITSVDTRPGADHLVVTGGVDGSVVLFDVDQQRVLKELQHHTKRVSQVTYANNEVLLSASYDKTVRIWRETEAGEVDCSAVLSDFGAEVVGVTAHPCGKYFVAACKDKTWSFVDLATATIMKQVELDALSAPYSCVQFHPDGLILGTGTEEKLVRIWEVKTQKNVAQFEGHSGPIKCLSFSENGYYLATAAEESIKLWDLRKLKNFRTLTPYEVGACNVCRFDHSGNYLAVGGPDVRIYAVKQDWSVVQTFSDLPKKGALATKFGTDARMLLVGASDHNLRVYGAQRAEGVGEMEEVPAQRE